MDEVDPETEAKIKCLLDPITQNHGIKYHCLRHRSTGTTLWMELHLLFPKGILLEKAHALATEIEDRLKHNFPTRTEVTTHLETLEDHAEIHTDRHSYGM